MKKKYSFCSFLFILLIMISGGAHGATPKTDMSGLHFQSQVEVFGLPGESFSLEGPDPFGIQIFSIPSGVQKVWIPLGEKGIYTFLSEEVDKDFLWCEVSDLHLEGEGGYPRGIPYPLVSFIPNEYNWLGYGHRPNPNVLEDGTILPWQGVLSHVGVVFLNLQGGFSSLFCFPGGGEVDKNIGALGWGTNYPYTIGHQSGSVAPAGVEHFFLPDWGGMEGSIFFPFHFITMERRLVSMVVYTFSEGMPDPSEEEELEIRFNGDLVPVEPNNQKPYTLSGTQVPESIDENGYSVFQNWVTTNKVVKPEYWFYYLGYDKNQENTSEILVFEEEKTTKAGVKLLSYIEEVKIVLTSEEGDKYTLLVVR